MRNNTARTTKTIDKWKDNIHIVRDANDVYHLSKLNSAGEWIIKRYFYYTQNEALNDFRQFYAFENC